MSDQVKCACVHFDAMGCARIRDGFDPDDEHWDHRKCECDCHDEMETDFQSMAEYLGL